mmetsp:Transcript_13369/g.31322  ORF Transcript_13369/g.31322 Transcript_13369/m.31322 type:complete len:586 (-) Transcript_13369:405-2162(-)
MSKRTREVPIDERVTPVKQLRHSEKTCVVGVDFGTARTGYAYAFMRNPDEIFSKQPGGQEAGKTHSSILLSADQKFIAFGSKAREEYFEHDERGLFFENYKMGLDDDLGSAPSAIALNQQRVPLLTVITETLGFVRKEAMEEINKSQLVAAIGVEEVQWVVTVPAIWKDKAKGLMREAAMKAGMITSLDSSNLQLALEPEAACMACETESKRMKVGNKFMVLDCGGGTVDITTYSVVSTDPWRIEELAVPSGGPWGSTFVDAQFEKFVQDLIGADTFRRFKPSAGWVELMETWENVKLSCNEVESFDGDLTKAINFAPMLDYLQGKTIASLVAEYNRRYGSNLQTRRATTVLVPLSKIQNFFRPVVEKIVKHVSDLLERTPVDYILLVGGFAESKFLMHRVKNAFENDNTRVVVPLRPSLAVVRGAVSFSLGKGQQIQSRLARYTYGVDQSREFDLSRFPEQTSREVQTYVVNNQSKQHVDDHFVSLVDEGQRVEPGHIAKYQFIPASDSQTQVTVNIFVSTRPDAKFTDEEGVSMIGSVTVPMTRGQGGDLHLGFGSTEIEATCVNTTTGKRNRTTINYKFSNL